MITYRITQKFSKKKKDKRIFIQQEEKLYLA